jgi:Ca2+-binding RTX toxin-like protein
MAITLDFFGSFSINMQNPTALYQNNVLVDFSTGYFPSPELGDGETFPCIILNQGGTAEIRLWGTDFVYDGDDFLVSGMIDQIEIYNAADLAANTDTWRELIFFDTAVEFPDVLDALLANNLSPLYAGQQLSISGDDLADTLVGGSLADFIAGYGGNDKLIGNGGGDALSGQGGADNLSGGAGADILSGGTGKDILTGGTGKDEFWFLSSGNTNGDTIKDFTRSQSDKIGLDNEVFTALGLDGNLASSKFKAASNIGATSGGTGVDSNDRVLYDTDTGKVYYDSNGSGAGGRVWVCTVFDTGTHHPTLAAGDFIVI